MLAVNAPLLPSPKLSTDIKPRAAFGAHQVPVVLKLVTVLGMSQARNWRVGTLNELRKFMDLKPHRSFEDINPDPDSGGHEGSLQGA
jgi:hypothetical protein